MVTISLMFFDCLDFNGNEDSIKQQTLKSVINCLNTNFYSYLETSDGQSYNLH